MTINPGAIRFNTDSMKLEIFRGSANYEGSASMAGIGTLAAGQWEEIVTSTPEVESGHSGFFAGGHGPTTPRVDRVTISTTGDATNFGDLVKQRQEGGGCSGRIYAYWTGDAVPASDASIDRFVMDSGGTATDYGDLVAATNNVQNISGFGSRTRGFFAGGYQASVGRVNTIQYFDIASTGAAIDFGDLDAAHSGVAGCSSQTRGFMMGGTIPSAEVNIIQFVTMSTLGNAADFGDMTDTAAHGSGCSNATRGIFFDRNDGHIDYFNMATLGDSQDFGDLNTANHYSAGSPSSSTRACYGGGGFPGNTDVIEYIQIATTGDAIDFGNLSLARNLMMTGCQSNGHGGL